MPAALAKVLSSPGVEIDSTTTCESVAAAHFISKLPKLSLDDLEAMMVCPSYVLLSLTNLRTPSTNILLKRPRTSPALMPESSWTSFGITTMRRLIRRQPQEKGMVKLLVKRHQKSSNRATSRTCGLSSDSCLNGRSLLSTPNFKRRLHQPKNCLLRVSNSVLLCVLIYGQSGCC